MKKLLMMVAACAVIASCQQKGKNATAENSKDSIMAVDTTAAAGVTYSGTIPAADGPGIKYTEIGRAVQQECRDRSRYQVYRYFVWRLSKNLHPRRSLFAS